MLHYWEQKRRNVTLAELSTHACTVIFNYYVDRLSQPAQLNYITEKTMHAYMYSILFIIHQ